jgi:uncharacterized phage protein (TIGR02220 family)
MEYAGAFLIESGRDTSASSDLVFQALARKHQTYVVYRYLESLVGTDTPVPTNGQIAEMFDVHRETIARAMRIFEKLGLIRQVFKGRSRIRQTVVMIRGTAMSSSTVVTLQALARGDYTVDIDDSLILDEHGNAIQVSTNEDYNSGVVSNSGIATLELQPTATCKVLKSTARSNISTDQENSTELGISTELFPPCSPPHSVVKRGKRARKPAAPESDVSAVFEFWRTEMGYLDRSLTSERQRFIAARLNDGYSVEQLKAVISVAKNDPFWRGENDRDTPYDDCQHLFRNATRVDGFLQRAAAPAKPNLGISNTAPLKVERW